MDEPMESEEEVQISTYLPGYDSVKNYTQHTLKAIVGATKAASALPDYGRDYEYYQSFPDFCELMKEQGKIILSAMSCLTKSQGMKKSFDDLTIEEAFELLAGINETILENADIALDNASGNKTKEQLPEEDLVVASVQTPMPINTSWNKVQAPATQGQTIRLLSAKNIQRPQMRFREKIDNSNGPFVPLLKWKPNSIKPLAILPEIIDGKEEYGNPYEWEIEKFQPSEEMLEAVEPMVPSSVEETTYIYVETEDQLNAMCEDLRQQKEIAIDLEHHSYRSFQGIVCLMQISTRTKDYVVDTLRLRSELQVLNEVFTDPKIVKVLHGADMDIVWLQRDFGLYVVNMFDTGQAARVLNFAHFSLAYMLKHYCRVETNKAFQLSDWRIRPLPAEMLKYAREDTHYLLYIYDCMKNDLLQKGNEVKNLLLSTFQRSKLICMKVYEKPVFHEDSYLEMYKKSKKVFSSRQLYALKELYSWRDKYAREEDESIAYVLPNHMLLQIAETLPREQQGILACCNPIPPVVRHQLNDIHHIILKARDSAISVFTEESKAPVRPEINVEVDLESILHCPHDIHHHHEETMHLATLFGEGTSENQSSIEVSEKPKPSLPLFTEKKIKVKSKAAENYANAIEAFKKYYSPYERYKLKDTLDVNYGLADGNDSLSDSDRISSINDHLKRFAAIADPDGDEDSLPRSVPMKKSATSTSNDNTPVATSHQNADKHQVEPLRKKMNDHVKRLAAIGDPDVDKDSLPRNVPTKKSSTSTSNENTPVAASHQNDDRHQVEPLRKKEKKKNKRKLDEAAPSENSTETAPASSGTTEGKNVKHSKQVFNPDKEHEEEEYKTPSKSWNKKRKHSKQASFSSNSEKSHGMKNWPKR